MSPLPVLLYYFVSDLKPYPVTEKRAMLSNKLKFASAELQNFNWIFSSAPCFPLDAARIRIINEPAQFYETLLHQFRTAKRRISVASLYVGTGDLERRLLDIGKNNLKNNEELKFTVLVDYQRGTRGVVNTRMLLDDFVQLYPSRCSVSLYQTPKLSGFLGSALPARYNELVGLQHMKLYISDDSVLLSGANCSNDYFLQRQDRYVHIEDKDLADFYSELIDEVSSFSRPVLYSDTPSAPQPSPSSDGGGTFESNASARINDLIARWTRKQQEKMEKQADKEELDAWVFPLVQMGQLGVRQDERTTLSLLAAAPRDSRLRLATGYFNLTGEYADTILGKCEADVSLLMAHPNANGFLNAPGVAGGIPYAYSLIARKFWERVRQTKQNHRVRLLEYDRTGWTFHAKGMWYYPPDSDVPWMTLVGSANLGERSVKRDLEAQAAIFTTSQALKDQLHEECGRLHEHAAECSHALRNRQIPLWVHTVVGIFRHYF